MVLNKGNSNNGISDFSCFLEGRVNPRHHAEHGDVGQSRQDLRDPATFHAKTLDRPIARRERRHQTVRDQIL